MTQDVVGELVGLLEKATPIREGWTLRVKDDGDERYDIIGHPCGFPVATFGDHNDAALHLAVRRLVPQLLADLAAARERVEEARRVLGPFAAVANDRCLKDHPDTYAPRPSRGRPCMADFRAAAAFLSRGGKG